MRKPSVDTNPVANKYARNSNERIIEFSSGAGGGLIAFREIDGKLIVEVYSEDSTVEVRAHARHNAQPFTVAG